MCVGRNATNILARRRGARRRRATTTHPTTIGAPLAQASGPHTAALWTARTTRAPHLDSPRNKQQKS
eukprot:6264785-Prymnesium_polylepis.1